MTIKINDGMKSFINSLAKCTTKIDCTKGRPILLEAHVGDYDLDLSVYLYNVLGPPGGRPTGEYKINLNVPGQKVGETASFDYSLGFTLCVGYIADYDIFVLWDAYKHRDFKYNSNLQIKVSTILGATYQPYSVQERDTEHGFEKVLCCVSYNLETTISERYRIYISELCDGKLFLKKRAAIKNENTLEIRLRVKQILEKNPRATIDQIAKLAGVPKSTAIENVKQLKNNDDVDRINLSEEQTGLMMRSIANALMNNPDTTMLQLSTLLDRTLDFISSFSKDYLTDNIELQDFIKKSWRD